MIYQNVDFIFDSDTGGIVHARNKYAGKTLMAEKYAPCSWDLDNGYKKTKVNGKYQGQHRVAWFLVYKYWPKAIDHINGIRHDNRLCNLREVTNEEQSRNQKLHSRNKYGISGVCFNKKSNSWHATIGYKCKNVSLGYFKDFLEACCVRKSAENKYGYHRNHGRK